MLGELQEVSMTQILFTCFTKSYLKKPLSQCRNSAYSAQLLQAFKLCDSVIAQSI